MHICHVNLASAYHGGENQTFELIKQQHNDGLTLTVVAKPNSPFANKVTQLGIRVTPVSNVLQGHFRMIPNDCDIVHVHQGRAIYWALIHKFISKTPYIITRRIDNKLKKKWLANIAYSNASAVVGLSTEIVNRIKKAYPSLVTYQIPSSPVSYPVNADKVSLIKAKYAHKFLVIHAANMVKHKGFDVTIAAAKKLAKTNSSVHICLLGDGKNRAELEKSAKDLTNLSFEGKQSSMGDWFEAADLQVHPSYSEGLGSVILEGAKAGLPIVATRAGGIPDIIEHNVNGLLIEPGDANALADTINELSKNKNLCNSLIKNCTYKLKPFLIECTSKQYSEIYRSIIK
ncbi:glycosyltransferase family 4 protein [Vibrio astriarenae]